MLSRNNLSNSEREKLNKLKSLYLNVLKKANNLGIDFFSKEIEYYEISHNKKESINNESTLWVYFFQYNLSQSYNPLFSRKYIGIKN